MFIAFRCSRLHKGHAKGAWIVSEGITNNEVTLHGPLLAARLATEKSVKSILSKCDCGKRISAPQLSRLIRKGEKRLSRSVFVVPFHSLQRRRQIKRFVWLSAQCILQKIHGSSRLSLPHVRYLMVLICAKDATSFKTAPSRQIYWYGTLSIYKHGLSTCSFFSFLQLIQQYEAVHHPSFHEFCHRFLTLKAW